MRKLKIFWCHPILFDYRIPLFEYMEKEYDIKFFFYETGPVENKFNHYIRQKKSRFLNLSDFKIFYKEIKEANLFISSHLRHKHTRLGLLIAFFLKKKVIIWNESSIISNNPRIILKTFFDKFFKIFVDVFIVSGEPQHRFLQHIGFKKPVYIIGEYPGVKFAGIEEKPVDKLSRFFVADKNVLLFIGRIIPLKGIDYLIKAFCKLLEVKKNWLLLIVGDGPSKETLVNMAGGNDKIVFCDPVLDVNEKSYLFKNSKITAVPSRIINKRYGEGGPLVILESLSAGTPVLTTDAVGSSTKFIKDGFNGKIANHSDVESLYNCLIELIELIENGRILKNEVIKDFERLPNHKDQANIFMNAISSI